ncbi:MAG TPA: hypothetical protein VIM41_07405 [Gammaproteobacteria bacterium]
MDNYYRPQYNIDLGLLNYLHPFDGRKFKHVYEAIKNLPGIVIKSPAAPVPQELIHSTTNVLLVRMVREKRYILRALEVPYLPLLPFSFIDNRVLLPMRWGGGGNAYCGNAGIGRDKLLEHGGWLSSCQSTEC